MSTPSPERRGLSCHCQAVVAYVQIAGIPTGVKCDCSYCSKKGILWGFASGKEFILEKGADAVTQYHFGAHDFEHFFCRNCGTTIASLAAGETLLRPSADRTLAYNLLAVRAFDPHVLLSNTIPFGGSKRQPAYVTAEPLNLKPDFVIEVGDRENVILNLSCQCKAVKAAVKSLPLNSEGLKITSCNCSWDGGNSISGIYPLSSMFVVSPLPNSKSAALTAYTRSDAMMHIAYHFCSTCGCVMYGSAPGEGMRKAGYGDAVFNARLIDGIKGNVWDEVYERGQKVPGRVGWGPHYQLGDR